MLADMARQGHAIHGEPRKPSFMATLAAAALPKRFLGVGDDDVESGRKTSTTSMKSIKCTEIKGQREKSHEIFAPCRATRNPVFDENEELEEKKENQKNQPENEQTLAQSGADQKILEKSEIDQRKFEKPRSDERKLGKSGNEQKKLENDEKKLEKSEPKNAKSIFEKESKNQMSKLSTKGDYFDLDKSKIRKMNTAVKLNRAIKEKSKLSRLVVLNLPCPPSSKDGLINYMDYLEAMTEGLERVLMVRGSGKEVVTIYS